MKGAGTPSAAHCSVAGSFLGTTTSDGCSVMRGARPCPPVFGEQTIDAHKQINTNPIGYANEANYASGIRLLRSVSREQLLFNDLAFEL